MSPAVAQEMMKDLVIPVLTMLVAVCASVALIDAVCVFHETYFKYSEKIESERWLLTQCKDPEFFANLRQHSELCFHVESNHRVGAFMLALKEAISSLNLEPYLARAIEDAARAVRTVGWPVLAATAAVCVLCPSLVVACLYPAQPAPPFVCASRYKLMEA